MITAGGALFASFRKSMHPVQRILSGINPHAGGIDFAWCGFEFRGKRDEKGWRTLWTGDFHRQPAPGLIVGCYHRQFDARLCHPAGYELLRRSVAVAEPYSLLGDWCLSRFFFPWCQFPDLEGSDEIALRARKVAWIAWIIATGLTVAFLLWTFFARIFNEISS